MPHFLFPRILPLFLLAAWPALSAERAAQRARETVIEDSPARLVLEVEAPAPVLEDGADGQKVRIPGFEQPSAIGAPALPWYGFQVATGSRAPSVSIEALDWVELPLSKELAGVPRWINTRQSEPARDAALFAAARGIAPRVSGLQLYRGLGLRKISLPAATYAEGSGRVRVLKKFRVTATFTGPASAPAAGVRPWLLQADVKNVNGGQYLVSLPRRPLRRSAAAKQFTSGSFIQIKVGDRILDGFDEDGAYSLTYEALSQIQNGISAVDPGRIRLYAGPQDVLGIPMSGLPASAGTLREIPIQIVEGTTGSNPNGTFDAGDRILFYGHGTSLWKPILGTTGPVRWQFTHDPYSYENYYYLDWSGSPTGASRLQTIPFVPAATTVTSAPHYLRGEKDVGTGFCDLSNAFDAETGHVWYWYWKQACPIGINPGFSGDSVTLTAAQVRSASADTLKGLVADSTLWFGAFAHGGETQDDFNVTSSGSLTYQALGVPGAWYRKSSGFSSDERLNLESLQWMGSNRRFEGYTVRYVRRLSWRGAPQRIFPAVEGQRIVYQVDSAAPGLRVLRVQEGIARSVLATQPAGSSILFSDSAGVGEDVHYHLYVNPAALAGSAVTGGSVSALPGVIQDLSNGDNKNPEYLILAPQALLSEALKLRDYREKTTRSTRWNTAVVRTEDIYREWSGGRLSPVALRDFLRWALYRWGAGGTQGNLKHVVLYGDGHYDYRDIRNGSSNTRQPNNIPPFNWDGNDFNPMNTDDFYAVLDSGEVWSENPSLDVNLGRLPLQTSAHAASYLEKISRYEDPKFSGEWRSRLLLTGDDDRQGDVASDGAGLHTQQAETLGDRVLALDSGMRKEQVYLFDYPRNSQNLKPEATQDLINFYNRGVLLSTFFGHGAYNQLADEVLLKTGDGLARFRNTDKLFLMSIFSCTVGRFDKLVDEGMSEQFLRVGGYGAIAAVSAARESYADDNADLGYAFIQRLFDGVADSVPRPIGEALRLAKNAIGNGNRINKQKYILQGEPVAVIHRPGLGISLDSVPDTLQAQGCDSITGRVTFGSGKGKVSLRILSADVPKTYIHTWSIFNSVPTNFPINVLKPGRILFERTVDYTNSAFSVGYFLPSQVPFGDTAAKFQLFAWDADSLRESAVLVANRRISGTRGTCVVDSDARGPRISVTGCNTKESGGVDFPDKVKIALPYCLQITVRDTVGGVLSGDGPDEGTTVEVVGSVAPYHPQAGVDDLYTKSYQLTLSNQDLTPGTHLLKVSARDGFGNLGTRQLSLEVTADTALRFIKAFNVPNPVKRAGTTFYFQTTLPVEEGEALVSPNVDRVNFHVRVFNQQGYMVREFRDAVSGETRWDGKDAWGRQLANGVYFYQVTATWGESDGSPLGGRRTSRKQVLVISR